ncbi:hypothetical protein D6T64_06460 [Cryobacterium melibiosiphilum]|uniref:TolB-like translocation protein n=1 Tax=Cryobacterium melibiosiphilum TaxID=995039 RepID=A0A3A5MP41_9MICO|nr:hypothetical protein [Cryobacterium melibiosiphilum]RJT89599.1 hypothetical protein D6T64_06460 [Cryobacterium melibiosiphilum]
MTGSGTAGLTGRTRWVLVSAAAVLLFGGAAIFGIGAFADYQGQQAQSSEVVTAEAGSAGIAAVAGSDADAPRIVFRNTALGEGYGVVAAVPLTDPSGPRVLSDVSCDRVYATNTYEMCLRVNRGVVTTFTADLLDARGALVKSWPLPGIPSRTRISADSELVSFSAFITGETYASVGFAINTQIAEVDGADSGTLEDFALTVAGSRVTAADRNIWGVTFTSDPNVFYATADSGGRTWLVQGDRAARTLVAVRDGVECPSVSPDGTHLAYKKVVSTTPTTTWTVAVLDLATNEEVVLPEPSNVDDQVEWLDDSTVIYGVLRADDSGDSDVWAAPRDGSSAPRLLIEHAWSPAVIR